MVRTIRVCLASLAILALLGGTACCQEDDMGLGELLGGMGGLGGIGGLGGMLGGLGGLGGGLGASMLGGGAAPAPNVIVNQPAMVISGDNLYIAYQGKVIRLNALTLEKKAEAWYDAPQAQLVPTGVGAGPSLISPAPEGTVPPLVPGATPSTGP